MSDAKVIAVNTIIRTVEAGKPGNIAMGIVPVKPIVQSIEPGTVFMADTVRHRGSQESEYDELKRLEAIRDWSAADEATFNRLSNVVGGGEFEQSLTPAEKAASVTQTDHNGVETTTYDAERTARMKAEKAEADRLERERAQKAEAERLAAEQKAAAAEAAAEKAEAERKAKEAKDAEAAAAKNKSKTGKTGKDTEGAEDVV